MSISLTLPYIYAMSGDHTMGEQCCAPRFSTDALQVEGRISDTPLKMTLLDVSTNGLRLTSPDITDANIGQPITVRIAPLRHEPLDCRGTVKWVEPVTPPKKCGVELDDDGALAPCSVMALTHSASPSEPSIERVEEDIAEVREQIRGIQQCRSQIFIGTLAALCAASFSTLIALAKGLGPMTPDETLATGCVLATGLLVIGIMATLEKARAINLRKGFLATVGEYLSRGQVPPGYRGWSQLQFAQIDCGLRRKAGMCNAVRRYTRQLDEYKEKCKRFEDDPVGNEPPGAEPLPPETCWTIGMRNTIWYSSKKHMWPGMLESFMAFSGYVYAILYLLLSGVTALTLGVLMHRLVLKANENGAAYLSTGNAGLVFGFGLLLGAVTVYRWRHRMLRKKQAYALVTLDGSEPARKAYRWFVGVFVALSIACAVIMALDLGFEEYMFFGLLFAGGCYIAGGAVYFMEQMAKVRRGLYSAEAMRASWHVVLLNCHVPQRST
ncbi:MAG: PilZ domain-containing protein [Planctomycetes bacterium]|nr:PilZ domain-containing protein [Planctomycetota bacterium]